MLSLFRCGCHSLFQRKKKKTGHNAFWDILDYKESIWCSLEVQEMKAAFIDRIEWSV